MDEELSFDELIEPSSLYGFEWVRKVERLGFIKPIRKEGRKKYYPSDTIMILRRVKFLRLLGYSIPQTRKLMFSPMTKQDIKNHAKIKDKFMSFVQEESND